MAQHAISVPVGRHRRARGVSATRRAVVRGALVGLALLVTLTIGHNVNAYHGTDQPIGVTVGHIGGCEVSTVDRAVSLGCWLNK